MTIVRRLSDIVVEKDIAVHTLSQFPELNNRYGYGGEGGRGRTGEEAEGGSRWRNFPHPIILGFLAV